MRYQGIFLNALRNICLGQFFEVVSETIQT